MTPTVELLRPRRLHIEGVIYERGKPTPVEPETALRLAEDGRFKVQGLTAAGIKNASTAQAKPRGDALTAAIVEAIGSLDEDDSNYDRSGKPSLAVLSGILGYGVSAAELDRALGSSAKPATTLEPAETEPKKEVRRKVVLNAQTAAAVPAAKEPDENNPKNEII